MITLVIKDKSLTKMIREYAEVHTKGNVETFLLDVIEKAVNPRKWAAKKVAHRG